MIILFQFNIIISIITLRGQFPGQPNELLNSEIRQNFHALRGFGYLYLRIMFVQSLTLFFCAFNILSLVVNIKQLESVINEFIYVVPALIIGTGIWLLS